MTFNESWGVRNIVSDKQQQALAAGLYYMTKALDKMRLISSNYGWEQIEQTDVFCIHDYEAKGEDFTARYSDFDDYLKKGVPYRLALCKGHRYLGQPIIISEYGGIAFSVNSEKGWGYNGTVDNNQEFLDRLASITASIRSMTNMCGFCYTQLTDVMQEVNGLMTADRKLKISVEDIRNIFDI